MPPFLRWLIVALIVLWLVRSILRRRMRLVFGTRWQEPRPEEEQRVQAGEGLGIDDLARRLDVSASRLQHFRPDYHRVTIPKRSGGQRVLHVPDRLTKTLQRTILRRLLARLRAHPAACGFERGRSIVDNARPHVGQAVVLRCDLVDFFPSTSSECVDAYFRRIGWDAEAAALLTHLTTHEGGLPQGAPTSPRLSNLLNFQLDVKLEAYAARYRGAYTRYADDLTFSFPRDFPKRMRAFLQKTQRLLKAHGYAMHEKKKLSIRRRHQRQVVTGIVVNDGIHLPRETRRWLRAVRHRAATGGTPTLTAGQLQGWNAFEKMVHAPAKPDDPS